MNNFEIDQMMRENQHTATMFQGVFSPDDLPSKDLHSGTGLILNFCPAKGCHWLSIYRTKRGRTLEIFDSSGMPTHKMNLEISAFVKRQRCRVIFNKKPLQSMNSVTCGNHCMIFLLFRSLGISMRKIINQYSEHNLKSNDRLVMQQFKRFFVRKKMKSRK